MSGEGNLFGVGYHTPTEKSFGGHTSKQASQKKPQHLTDLDLEEGKEALSSSVSYYSSLRPLGEVVAVSPHSPTSSIASSFKAQGSLHPANGWLLGAQC